RVADGQAGSALPDMAAGETACVALDAAVSDVARWDVLDPHLYALTACLSLNGEPVDDLIDRVGFRTVQVKGEAICLNGRRVFLKGFNRHEEHGQFGCALSVEAMAADLQLVLDTGANSIRTCHYPNDPRFLDLCDELGVLVWEEHHARALPHDVMAKPLFEEQISACNHEMIAQHVNHPCIYVWGVLNECESETEFGREIYARNLNELRALDPTRPVTFASCRYFKDICLDLVDIASFNIYPGWYVREDVRAFVNRLLQWMDENGAANKPIIISEIGAGGIAGYHDPFGEAKWSEERQASIIGEQLDVITTTPRLSGLYMWQFADVRVSEEWAMPRPKTMNNKGIVDTYRRPKLAYATVKRVFRGMK
ncbi:MAG: beta-glucuronidase, partial [Clostridia bacterium]|nr:beta-glucuronidase [Clostridia bacterium]